MKISDKWLREWLTSKLDAKALAERLTSGGIEVSSVTPAAALLEHVIVGEIRAITPHPSADRLRLCEVHIGKAKSIPIVCGASNARAGMKAPVALPGATLPNGMTIAQTEVRGVMSAGMLCSAAELGLEDNSDGLLDLGAKAQAGMKIDDLLELDDSILEIELTPNRGDCLSVLGIAREAAALIGARLTVKSPRPAKLGSRRRFAVVLQAPADCPRYVGRAIENIDPAATTPLWLRERLRRAGQRCVHPVVDVTNYVMLELGQPLHAFDLDRLVDGIVVRHAQDGEPVTLLDGRTVKVKKGALLIADARAPVALAGIMGGRDSAVGDATRHLFLESAYFRPEAISTHARALGIQTESSQRFERGVDPALQRVALERATGLLLQIVGGQAGPIVERSVKRYLPGSKPVLLRMQRVERLLGIGLERKTTEAILTRLQMSAARVGKNLRVLPPSWRFDIRREVDLIEELARLYGYEKLPSTPPLIEMAAPRAPEGRIRESRLRAVLVDRDYHEVITYSFVDPKLQALLDPDHKPLALANPISAEMAVMRTSLWPGLLQTVVYNRNRQQPRLRIFEIGRRFLPMGEDLNQEIRIAGAVMGPAFAQQWGVSARAVDFHDVKADLEALFALSGAGEMFRLQATTHPALHPGRAATVRRGDIEIGHLGVLHPELQAKLSLEESVILFELSLEALRRAKIPAVQEISRFPSVRRDLSFWVPDTVSAEAAMDCVANAAGKLLINLELFDEYRGKGIDSGRKSLALGLTLQDSSRTLKENQVDAVITQIIAALQSELGGQLRG